MLSTADDAEFMRLAIAKAREALTKGQTPFGACIVRAGKVIACEHNLVLANCDSTAHAEVTAIRAACKTAGGIDLAGSTIYSTTEPCPMCFAAIHWANCRRIVYGASIADARAAGFRELTISNETMKQLGGSNIDIVGGVLAEENRALFDEFRQRGGKVY